ncbi:cupin domain [Roseimicrobium gellanilyticum]|uniref:Cupin domain n=1 Tax=Roseimicrobium gellanilyticum TaxID=748857 RepID=A0A366HT73_9BACT|nr:cupin domain-containing protein [Roseimicrobium gellanilyticum]RBP45897.1 cupin domain [Roseimicrobium gellanilyticum]
MPTLRDGLIIMATLGVAIGAMTVAQEVPAPAPPSSQQTAIMGSTVFDWTQLPVKKTAKGEVRKVVQAPTATLDELECHITTLNPGQEAHAPHQHPDEELLIVKEGTVESLVNGVWTKLGPGSVIFQASNQMHSIRNAGDTLATYHVIKWNSPGMLKKKAAGRLKAQTEPLEPVK